jgi:hypothetical protein
LEPSEYRSLPVEVLKYIAPLFAALAGSGSLEDAGTAGGTRNSLATSHL